MRQIRAKCEKELAELKRELTIDLPREIQRAVAMGDLRENAEYTAALERQAYVKARIGQLTDRLTRLSAIRLSQIPRDRAAFGSILKVRDLSSRQEQTYELGLPDDNEATPGVVSVSSPLGRAFLGKSVGDEIIVETPAGRRELELVDLQTLHERDAATGDEDVDA